MFKSNRRGNSYIEIMVVVAVLLIITLFAVPRYLDLRRDAMVAQLNNDTRILTTQVLEAQFNSPEGEWPVKEGEEVKEINGLNVQELDEEKLTNKVNSKVADKFFVVISGDHEGDVVIEEGIKNKDKEGNTIINYGSGIFEKAE